jgi:hypothetical protein
MHTSSCGNINIHSWFCFSVSDRLSTGIAVADIDFSLLDSVRAKIPIAKVSFMNLSLEANYREINKASIFIYFLSD